MKFFSKSVVTFVVVILLILLGLQYFALKSVLFDSNSIFISKIQRDINEGRLSTTDFGKSLKLGSSFNVEAMNTQDLFDYVLWTNGSSCRLAHDFGGVFLRNPVGYAGQKTVCLDPVQVSPPAGKCLVYSFGINDEWSFDEAMADYGCQVYSFDPSMNAKDHDHSPSIHYFNLGLTGNGPNSKNGWRLMPLSAIYDMLKERHGNVVIDYLKIDIEFDEWLAIPEIIQSGMLDNVRQLGIEIHLVYREDLDKIKENIRIIRSIEEHGMVRFDSELNPWSMANFKVLQGAVKPFAYEIAWYNSKFL